ncbi:MAG: EF-hand domain-containing protein [Limisphaerales bacterium]
MKKNIIVVLAALLACVVSGCVTKVTTENEPRKNVRFESAQATQIFYDAYLAHNYNRNWFNKTNAISRTVSIGIHLPYWQYKTSTDNVRFNRAIELADTNHDGVISFSEAQTYATEVLPVRQ